MIRQTTARGDVRAASDGGVTDEGLFVPDSLGWPSARRPRGRSEFAIRAALDASARHSLGKARWRTRLRRRTRGLAIRKLSIGGPGCLQGSGRADRVPGLSATACLERDITSIINVLRYTIHVISSYRPLEVQARRAGSLGCSTPLTRVRLSSRLTLFLLETALYSAATGLNAQDL